MQDEVDELNREIKAKFDLIMELQQRMQVAGNEVLSNLERSKDKQAWAALDRYYAARDTLVNVDQDLAVLIDQRRRLEL